MLRNIFISLFVILGIFSGMTFADSEIECIHHVQGYVITFEGYSSYRSTTHRFFAWEPREFDLMGKILSKLHSPSILEFRWDNMTVITNQFGRLMREFDSPEDFRRFLSQFRGSIGVGRAISDFLRKNKDEYQSFTSEALNELEEQLDHLE